MVTEKFFKEVNQIGMVVRDLQETMEHYWNEFGMGPWKVYLFQSPLVWDMTIKEKPTQYKMILAMYQTENIVIELIQPLSGDTTYKEFLEQKGEGIHHLGFFIDRLDQEVERFRNKGIATIQTGRYQGGGYAYLDTQERFGTIFELIERSKPPLTPIRVWPESRGEI